MSKLKYNITEKSKQEQDVDIIVSKKLLEHIKEFFDKDEGGSRGDGANRMIQESQSPHHSHPHFDINGKHKSFKRTNVAPKRNKTLKKK